MIKRKSFLILWAMLGCMSYAHAQFDVKLHITDGITDTTVKNAIESNTSLLLSEIGNAFAEERTPDFAGIAISREGAKTLLDTWFNTSKLNCSVSELNRKCIKRYNGGYQIRDIPVVMLDNEIADTNKQQEIVINYTSLGKIDEVFISKDEHRISSMLTEGMEVKELWRRQILVDFVEQFRTAYNTKDLAFLNTVYSDDALIITGKVIKRLPNKDMEAPISMSKEQIEYTTQTKEQYLQKVEYIFTTVKYINLDFTDIEVQQHPKYPEIYGIVFKQKWNTTYKNGKTYNDVGYVFLMIDFKNENAPMINVRTWQPEKFKGKDLSKDEIFRVTYFKVNRPIKK
jgi:hypothetical protein